MAIKALVYLGLTEGEKITSPRTIAEAIDCSPSYLVKTLRLLVRAGILRSQRGAHGGVWLARPLEEITLLNVVEACQGLIIGKYCQALGADRLGGVCSFHRAMQEIHDVTTSTLARWTLAQLVQCPGPADPALKDCGCKMTMRLGEMEGTQRT